MNKIAILIVATVFCYSAWKLRKLFTSQKQDHVCYGVIVDHDIPKNKWLRRCDTCGRVYESDL